MTKLLIFIFKTIELEFIKYLLALLDIFKKDQVGEFKYKNIRKN